MPGHDRGTPTVRRAAALAPTLWPSPRVHVVASGSHAAVEALTVHRLATTTSADVSAGFSRVFRDFYCIFFSLSSCTRCGGY